MIVCGLVEKKWMCVGFVLSLGYIYIAVGDPVFKRSWHPINQFNPSHVCALPKPGSEFPPSCVLFILHSVSEDEM
jgi:hypothetical protein